MSQTGDDGVCEELEALLQQAEACRVLDGLERSGGLPPDRLAAARDGYLRLQHCALRAVSDLAALQRRLEQLLTQLSQVEVQQQIVGHGFNDPVEIIDKFREDCDRAKREASLAADGEEAARRQAELLQQRVAHLTQKLTEAEDERRAELAPDIKAAKDDISLLQVQLAAEQAKAAGVQREAADIAAKLETLQLSIHHLRSALKQESQAAAEAEAQPGRARQQADLAVNALRLLRDAEAEVQAQLRVQEAAEHAQLQESKELQHQQAAVERANERLQAQLAAKERGVEEVARDIEMAKVEAEKLLAEQVAWDLEVEKKKADAKREAELAKGEQRGREAVQRRLNRAELEAAQLQEQLPGLQNTVANLRVQLGAEQRQAGVEAGRSRQLAGEVAGLVEAVAEEKKLTEVQAALVKASLADVRHTEEECAALRQAAEERDKAIRAATSQRDAAIRFVNQRLQRLGEVIDEAEAKDGEVEELRKKRGQVKAAQRDLQELCGLMSGQMGRFKTLLDYAHHGGEDLRDKLAAAEGELSRLKEQAEGKGREVRAEERARASCQADKAVLASQLAAMRRRAAAAAEAADVAHIEWRLMARGAEEGREASGRLEGCKEAALAAKAAAQQGLLERDEELCGLYERSEALQQEIDEGVLAMQRCDDDMRLLRLEAAELQRCLFATHKTAPDVISYDRQIASLKAEVLKARREADSLGCTLESPTACKERWRVLPGRLPSREDLAARISQVEGRLEARKEQSAQKECVLEELERLTEGLVDKARASHDPAFHISLSMNEARRAQQQITRRMMAAVSELSLYQALSLKYAADRDALRADLEAARHNVTAGRPPTAGADREFARLERERAAEVEVRAQAAELRQLKADGMPGTLRSTASPRPQAYISDDLGLPKPFPAAFKPFKPADTPPAVAAAVAASRAQQQQQAEAAAAVLGVPAAQARGSSSSRCGTPAAPALVGSGMAV